MFLDRLYLLGQHGPDNLRGRDRMRVNALRDARADLEPGPPLRHPDNMPAAQPLHQSRGHGHHRPAMR